MEGDLTLEEANTVYTHGISQAISEGKYRQQLPSRVLTQRTADGYYVIQSSELSPSVWYNTFIIYNSNDETEIRILDLSADGTLDEYESGSGDLEMSQLIYSRMLEEGVQAGRIVRVNGGFIVEVPR
ncbi:MAG: hypothetical protein AAF361_08125 [Bacteroidota bacterium]